MDSQAMVFPARAAHPSSDRFAATFSLKGRREEERRRLRQEPPSPLEGEGSGVRGVLSSSFSTTFNAIESAF